MNVALVTDTGEEIALASWEHRIVRFVAYRSGTVVAVFKTHVVTEHGSMIQELLARLPKPVTLLRGESFAVHLGESDA
jgi:hypothetical protein